MVIENKVETLTITTFSFSQESPPCRYLSVPLHFPKLTISSPDHSTSNNEDAFSFNILDYVSTIPDYSPASSGKTYSNGSNNSTGKIPPKFSPFHSVQAYNAANKLPNQPQDPITPPTILTSSSVLPPSPLFDPRHFFVLEELLPPKKQIHPLSSSSTTLSNSLLSNDIKNSTLFVKFHHSYYVQLRTLASYL
nr:hypothetical protein [Tanacetum cinerariifolium]